MKLVQVFWFVPMDFWWRCFRTFVRFIGQLVFVEVWLTLTFFYVPKVLFPVNDSREVSSTFLQILLRVLPMSSTIVQKPKSINIFFDLGAFVFLDFLHRTVPSSNFFLAWTDRFLENSSRSFTPYGWIFQKSVWVTTGKTEMSEMSVLEKIFGWIFQ